MQNGIFQLNWSNVADAALTAVITAVIVAIYGIATTKGFDVFTADWGSIGRLMVNISVITGVASLAKNFLSTNQGSTMGVGPASSTSAKG